MYGMTTNTQQITLAVLYTKEDARAWARSWIDKTKETTNANSDKETTQTFDEFKTAIEKQFIPSTSEDILQAKWDRISQIKDGKIRSITSVAADLKALALQLPSISDFTKKHRLLSAMIPDLGAQVR